MASLASCMQCSATCTSMYYMILTEYPIQPDDSLNGYLGCWVKHLKYRFLGIKCRNNPYSEYSPNTPSGPPEAIIRVFRYVCILLLVLYTSYASMQCSGHTHVSRISTHAVQCVGCPNNMLWCVGGGMPLTRGSGSGMLHHNYIMLTPSCRDTPVLCIHLCYVGVYY